MLLHVQRADAAAGSPTLTVTLKTAMQKESEEGWVALTAFTAVTAANTAESKHFTQFLRFLRWTLTLSGSSPVCTFTLQGIGRRWA